MSTFSDRFQDARDRILASRRFQTWAASSFLTRRIARKHARSLFDLCAGFVYSQALYACVKLDIFEILKLEPLTADALARRLSLSDTATTTLLDAAVSLQLLSRRSAGRYGLGPHGAALLGNPGVTAMIRHHPLLYADLADPVELLRRGGTDTQLSRFWAYARTPGASALSDDQIAPYTELMSASQSLVADDILDAYDVARHERLLDIGGGDGTFLARAAERAPNLSVVLFDLPAVAVRARTRFEKLAIGGRASAIGGDFTRDPLPNGADLVTLIRLIHDHDDKKICELLAAVRRSLVPGGTLLIAEPLADTKGAEPMGDAYFGFYLMAMGSGRPRSFETISKFLCDAGFSSVKKIATRQPLQTSVVTAKC